MKKLVILASGTRVVPVEGADGPLPVLPCMLADAPPAPGRPQGAIDSELHHAASHGAPAAASAQTCRAGTRVLRLPLGSVA